MREHIRTEVVAVRSRCVHRPLVTAAAIAAVVATAFRFHVFARELPLGVALRYGFSGRALSMGHWGTLVTSQFLTRDAFMAVSIALSLAVMLGVYEMIAGSKRALLVTAVTALAGPVPVAGMLGIGSALGVEFAARTLSTLDYGASAVTAGAGGALVGAMRRRRLTWFALLWVLGGLVFHHQLADWEHFGSFVVGAGLGRALGVSPRPTGRSRVRFARRPLRSWALPATVAVLAATVAGSITAAASVPTPAARPTVVSVTYPTPSLGGARAALVILPVGYQHTMRRYPVVEMLHGTPGSPSDIITGFDPAGAAARPGMPPFIGVAPDGHGPVVSNGAFADTAKQHLGAAVSVDLQSWMNRRYRTNGHWSVTGLSDGGYGAAYLGSRTPRSYDRVCAMSGTFTPHGAVFAHESPTVRRAANPQANTRPNGPSTLLITGRSDTAGVHAARSYAQSLQRSGQQHRLLVAPGGHDWRFWHRQFPRCLRFLLRAGQPWRDRYDAGRTPDPPSTRIVGAHAPRRSLRRISRVAVALVLVRCRTAQRVASETTRA